MSLIKCPECGKEISDHARRCPNCGYPLEPKPIIQPQNRNETQRANLPNTSENSKLLIAVIITILGCLLLLNILTKNRGGSGHEKSEEIGSRQEEEIQMGDPQNYINTNITINSFDYSIDGNTVLLNKYNGSDHTLVIESNYTIDGMQYDVNLDNFCIGMDNNSTDTLIISEGITSVNDAIFNGCEVTKIFFPKSLSVIYDNTLAYLDADHIDIYYAGSEEEWYNIFQTYIANSISEKLKEGDGTAAGKALAYKVNSFIGHKYDASKFKYHFESNVEDVK